MTLGRERVGAGRWPLSAGAAQSATVPGSVSASRDSVTRSPAKPERSTEPIAHRPGSAWVSSKSTEGCPSPADAETRKTTGGSLRSTPSPKSRRAAGGTSTS